MSWQRVGLIFVREIRDQLRDRRTLFMIAVLPLILYPALGMGVMQMTLLLREEQQTVVVLNAEDLPGPPLIERERFAARWFESPDEAGKLRVVTVSRGAMPSGGEHAGLEDAARRLAELQAKYRQAEARGAEEALERLESRRGAVLEESGIQILINVPVDLKERFERFGERAGSDAGKQGEVEFPSPEVVYNAASEKGRIAFSRVEKVYRRWKRAAIAEQMEQVGLPARFAEALDAEVVDVAGRQDYAQSIWSRVLPGLLVLMTLTGAFYPAIDLAAGEKERGTMETLLICPATRTEIVAGKFLTVVSFAICTAVLNLVSMGLTGQYLASAALAGNGGMEAVRSLLMPSAASLAWVGVLLLPVAALFSAICLALATFARSTKEGQYYLTPILLITVGLTMFAQMPTVELSPLNSVIPVTGVVLLLKGFLGGEAPYAYLLPVLLTSFGYAGIAIWWAVEQFQREDVLFREAEQFEPRLWLRRLLREKGDVPSFGAAGFCFLLIMLLQFGAMRLLAPGIVGGENVSAGVAAARLLILQKVLIIAGPALLLGVLLTRSSRTTFRWRVPEAKYLLIGLVLPVVLMPLSATLAEKMSWFFPELPESVTRLLELMRTEEIPIGLLLLSFAVAPAICEELAFRGFILSGFLRTRHQWLAIVLSAFLFGLMHMIPQQAFNAALLGLVLGLLAVRSGSLWPCVLFHLMFNGSAVLQQRYGGGMLEDGYPWWVLVGCLVVGGGILGWLVQSGERKRRLEEGSPAILSQRRVLVESDA